MLLPMSDLKLGEHSVSIVVTQTADLVVSERVKEAAKEKEVKDDLPGGMPGSKQPVLNNRLPIAGATTTFKFYSFYEDVAASEKEQVQNTAKSIDNLERLDGVQRSLNENTRHNFVKKGACEREPPSRVSVTAPNLPNLHLL